MRIRYGDLVFYFLRVKVFFGFLNFSFGLIFITMFRGIGYLFEICFFIVYVELEVYEIIIKV